MTSAPWLPVVIGVDASPSSADAVRLGWELAQAAGTTCRLVHATPEAWTVPPASTSPTAQPDAVNESVRLAARAVMLDALGGNVPDDALATLEVRTGRAAAVLLDVADELSAGLVMLGGKHHSLLGRWVVGSTADALVRVLDVPLLVTAHTAGPVDRVLAAVDLSDAAEVTLRVAERYAALFGAELHLLHVVEPLPLIPEAPVYFTDEEAYLRSAEHLQRVLWPLVRYPGATTSIVRGAVADCIAAEVAERRAQLVVLGSHGKSWVDRILIGSVTEQVLHALPCSMLVIPVPGPGRRGRRRGRRTASHGPAL
jgi:nucleotide-binding universal stress UspA family protein